MTDTDLNSGGDLRQVILIAPIKANTLEQCLIKFQHAASLAGPDRDIDEVALLTKINNFWPGKKLTLEEVQGILSYWHHFGKLFT